MNIQGIFFLLAFFVIVLLFVQKLIKLRKSSAELENARLEIEGSQTKLLELQSKLAEDDKSIIELNKKADALQEKYNTDIRSSSQKVLDYETKYGYFISADQELANRKKALADLSGEFDLLNNKYQEGRQLYQSLEAEIDLYRDTLDISSYGLYEPKYNFEFPEQYLVELEGNYAKQKAMIKAETAVVCHTNWEVGGSAVQGRKMVKQEIKLMLYAFNGECDGIVAKVKWNNAAKSRERISKCYSEINKLGAVTNIVIMLEYYQLKQEELSLAYEYEKKKHDQKEEQRLIREQMREEEKAQRELQRAQQEADEEAKMYEKVLAKAREELGLASKEEQTQLQERINALQEKLQAALDKSERARSRAQDTKQGNIYVISNIGSFGENIYKIGMTRRLEPMDRIRELSDAALPFQFDVHAIIDSDNAPEFERGLHKAFWEKRINLVNARKEFFKITLEEIEKHVLESNATIQFTKIAEAREYRQTLSLIDQLKIKESETPIKS